MGETITVAHDKIKKQQIEKETGMSMKQFTDNLADAITENRVHQYISETISKPNIIFLKKDDDLFGETYDCSDKYMILDSSVKECPTEEYPEGSIITLLLKMSNSSLQLLELTGYCKWENNQLPGIHTQTCNKLISTKIFNTLKELGDFLKSDINKKKYPSILKNSVDILRYYKLDDYTHTCAKSDVITGQTLNIMHYINEK